MAMQSDFSAVGTNQFTRKWGGTEQSVNPYVTGYFFTHWSYIPKALSSSILDIRESSLENRDITQLLAGSCLAVTLPGGTVNKAEYMGLGGVKFAVPTNVEFDNTVTLKFIEYATLPIVETISGWVRMIRNYSTGVSELGTNYSKESYAGTMYYWTTKPNGLEVEYAACLTGMFPLKDPMDLLGHDLSTYDKLEIDIDFNVDYIWREEWVYDSCRDLATTFYNEGTAKVDDYGATNQE